MALIIELPEQILRPALEMAIKLRERNARAATNDIIRQALESESRAITQALTTIAPYKPSSK